MSDFIAIAIAQAFAVALSLFALSSGARRWLDMPPWQALVAGFIALGLAGIALFWAAFIDVSLMLPLRLVFAAAIVALTGWAIAERSSADRELLAPCVLAFIASVVLLVWAFQTGADDRFEQPLRHMMSRWRLEPLASDNEIPWLFAREIQQAQLTTPMLGDWLSSDRPPLQTGLYMLLNLGGDQRLWYQANATALQMSAVAMVWAMMRALGADARAAIIVAIAAAATPLVITNGVYVWPKLLGTAFVCGAFVLHFYGQQKTPWATGVLAGAAAALAMLAHGTSAFALLGIAIAALALRHINSWRYVLIGIVSAAALYAPWAAYQKFYDPPGDRLLKWHLAGVVLLDDRPFGQALSDAYGLLTPAAWVEGRINNVAVIVGAQPSMQAPSFSRANLREAASASVAISMGLLALALWAAPAMLWARAVRPLAAAALATLLIWSILIYMSGFTLAKHGSFFPQLALITAAGALLWTTPRRRLIGLALVAGQVILAAALYV